MKTTLLQATAAALALSGNVAAKVWYTEKTYDATNFFDEFSFWEVRREWLWMLETWVEGRAND
jgi:hypothetical protein